MNQTTRSNEDKLELFADLLEPAGAILSDRGLARLWQLGDRFGAIRAAIKGHKREVIEIMARFEGVEPRDYKIDGIALFLTLAKLFNRPDLDGMTENLFTSQHQSEGGAPSGAATENTGDGAI